jgi:hypothetical protein
LAFKKAELFLEKSKKNTKFSETFVFTIQRLTLAFSCGARSAFKLKEQVYLRSRLSRRQLQGFVGLRV